MIYAYVLCDPASAAPPPRRRGLGDARLRVVRSGALAAVYSRHRTLRPEPTREALLVHERVVEAVMARGAVLPFRFDTELESERDLAARLAERHDELVRALNRVRGRVELGLRVIAERRAPVLPDGAERSGRAYVLGLVDAHRRADRAAHELHEPLEALAVASTVRAPARPPAILAASYLVDAGRVAAFRSRVDELAAGCDDVDVVLTGPWPPYNFAGQAGT